MPITLDCQFAPSRFAGYCGLIAHAAGKVSGSEGLELCLIMVYNNKTQAKTGLEEPQRQHRGLGDESSVNNGIIRGGGERPLSKRVPAF